MNPDWELQARKEGALYFDEDYDSLTYKDKYKHEMYLNTGFWWFRKYRKEILIFTDQIADTEYLFSVINKETIATIYYHSVSRFLNFDELLLHYSGTKVVFKQIGFIPSSSVQYKTCKGKIIPYATIVLASNDTIIFDKKMLGLKKDSTGDRQVYRIKDKGIYQSIRSQFESLEKSLKQ